MNVYEVVPYEPGGGISTFVSTWLLRVQEYACGGAETNCIDTAITVAWRVGDAAAEVASQSHAAACVASGSSISDTLVGAPAVVVASGGILWGVGALLAYL